MIWTSLYFRFVSILSGFLRSFSCIENNLTLEGLIENEDIKNLSDHLFGNSSFYQSLFSSTKKSWELDRFRGNKNSRFVSDAEDVYQFEMSDKEFKQGCESILLKFSNRKKISKIIQNYNIYATEENKKNSR